VLIGISSLLYTNKLVNELKEEERKKVELWASATKQLIDLNNPDANIDFLFQVIENNNTVPAILADSKGDTISSRNIDSHYLKNPKNFEKLFHKMKSEHEPIEIFIGDDIKNYIYYKDSLILTKLKYYPYVQLGVIMLFIFVSYLAFSGFRKFEQNQVWVGLTKETAHQLGTPTSSLIGWVDVLKMKNTDPKLVSEFERDVQRLEKITERFSKVGSKPKLTITNIVPVIYNAVNYIKNRSSNKIRFSFNFPEDSEIMVPLNISLFEWVVENLAKKRFSSEYLQKLVTSRLKEFASLVEIIPGTTREILKKLSRGHLRFEFEHLGLELFSRNLDRIANRLSFTMVVSAIIIIGFQFYCTYYCCVE
jgi:hypothetical protein